MGYPELDTCIASVDPRRAVLVLPIIERRSLRLPSCMVVCQQVASDDTVLYCRLVIAGVPPVPGQSIPDASDDRLLAFESYWRIVRAYLHAECGLDICEALVAMPSDLLYVPGAAGCAVFDDRTRRYIRCNVELAASGRAETVL